MKKLLLTTITLTAIGVAVKVTLKKKSISSIEFGEASVKIQSPNIELDGWIF